MSRRSSSYRRVGGLLAAAALVTAACGTDGGGGSARGNVDDVLKVGLLLPQTGDLAALGPPMFKGAELALQEINTTGGVLGKAVQVVRGDDGGGSNNDLANATADRMLTSDRVDVILGAAASTTTKAVIDKITGAGVVMCSPSNTSAEMSTLDDNGGYYFRTAPSDSLQGPALADVITGDGHSRIGLIVRNDSYGVGFGDALKKALRANGATLVPGDAIAYDPKGTAFDADVKKLVDARPDAIVLVSFPDTGSLVIKSLIQQNTGPSAVPLYVTDGLQSNDLYKKIDPANPAVVSGIKGTAPAAAPTGGAPGFPSAFAAFAPSVDTIFSAHAYDCMIVLALAAKAAGSDDPAKIRAEMVNVTKGGEKCSTYADCARLLDQGRDIDYDGASGKLDFARKQGGGGEPSAGTYDVWRFGPDGTYTTQRDQVTVST